MPRSKPCSPNGTGPADTATADRLRPRMNGPRLGRRIAGQHVCCARVIVTTTKGRGLPPRAAVIAVTTAIAESTLNNYIEAVDHDSLGLFQQRPSMGWGTPAQLTDPVYATNAFLNAMLRKYPDNRWMTGDIGAICQKVQVSAVPDAYGKEVHDAQLIVEALWTGGSVLTGAPADINGDGHVDVLARFAGDGRLWVYPGTGRTGMETFGERYQVGVGWENAASLSLADVNGDGHADILARFTDGTLFVYPGTGKTGTETFGERYQVGVGWENTTALAVADINGDGHVDILVRFGDGLLWVYPGTGKTGTETFGPRYQVGVGWENATALAVADINGDGHPDILARFGDGLLWVYPGTGKTGTETFGPRYQVGVGWENATAIT